MTKEEMEIYDMMVETGLATTEELNLARNLVDGTWKYVLDRVCFIKTGYGTFWDYIWSEDEEEDE